MLFFLQLNVSSSQLLLSKSILSLVISRRGKRQPHLETFAIHEKQHQPGQSRPFAGVDEVFLEFVLLVAAHCQPLKLAEVLFFIICFSFNCSFSTVLIIIRLLPDRLRTPQHRATVSLLILISYYKCIFSLLYVN